MTKFINDLFIMFYVLSMWNVRSLYRAGDIRTIERNADVLLNACEDIGLAVNIGKTKYMEIGHHRGMIANVHIKIGSNSYKKWKRLNT